MAAPDPASDRPLHDRVITLAGRPDDDSRIAADLVDIAALTAGRVTAVDYASVTSGYPGAYATVAASSELAKAMDAAQYSDESGPCMDALNESRPVSAPDIPSTMTWPGFRDSAIRLGLRASLSIPLFAGRGTTIAALNLYAHEPDAMKALTAAVWSVYESDSPPDPRLDELDSGGNELVAGLAGAFAVQARIQRAVGLLMSRRGIDADQAFEELCHRAAATGAALPEVAAHLLAEPVG
jgi:hypothetical protein